MLGVCIEKEVDFQINMKFTNLPKLNNHLFLRYFLLKMSVILDLEGGVSHDPVLSMG